MRKPLTVGEWVLCYDGSGERPDVQRIKRVVQHAGARWLYTDTQDGGEVCFVRATKSQLLAEAKRLEARARRDAGRAQVLRDAAGKKPMTDEGKQRRRD